jgi:hypothetical protein
VVEKPEGLNIIYSRWACKKKYDAQENLIKFKSRIIPLGYQEKYGIDYQETFAPADMNERTACYLSSLPNKEEVQTRERLSTQFLMDLDSRILNDKEKCCLL